MTSIAVSTISYHRDGVGVGFFAVAFHVGEHGAMGAAVYPPEDFQTPFDGCDWSLAAETPHRARIAVFDSAFVPHDIEPYCRVLYRSIGEYTKHFGSMAPAAALMRGDIVLDGVTWRQ